MRILRQNTFPPHDRQQAMRSSRHGRDDDSPSPLLAAPNVAVLLDTAVGWSRNVIRGIAAYARNHGTWNLWLTACGREIPPCLPKGWEGQGVIARVYHPAMVKELSKLRIPVVNVSSLILPGPEFHRVTSDLTDSGRLAAEHLRNCGLRNFAYCGVRGHTNVKTHYLSFLEDLKQKGFSCSFHVALSPKSQSGVSGRERDLGQWLKSLPKPVGILAWDSQLGREIIEACRRKRIFVPEEAAVMGGDFDDLLCETCEPTLSGAVVPAEDIGREAADLLDRLMRGERPPKTPLFLPHLGVAARHSTNVLAMQNKSIVQAIHFIRENAHRPISVADVLRAVPLSRRQLERDFRRELHRTPAEEIRRVHLELARELLRNTDLSIDDIARASGFGSPDYFGVFLKQKHGVTPIQFRKQLRGRH
jgi:LacI family transcriptional regulator